MDKREGDQHPFILFGLGCRQGLAAMAKEMEKRNIIKHYMARRKTRQRWESESRVNCTEGMEK